MKGSSKTKKDKKDLLKKTKYAPIKNFPNYVATQDGRIINVKFNRVLKGTLDKDGYRYVMLSKNGKKYTKKVHRLVYEAFHGKINKNIDIHHVNQNRDSNSLRNLIAIPKGLHISLHKRGSVTSEETKRKISESVKKARQRKKGLTK